MNPAEAAMSTDFLIMFLVLAGLGLGAIILILMAIAQGFKH